MLGRNYSLYSTLQRIRPIGGGRSANLPLPDYVRVARHPPGISMVLVANFQSRTAGDAGRFHLSG